MPLPHPDYIFQPWRGPEGSKGNKNPTMTPPSTPKRRWFQEDLLYQPWWPLLMTFWSLHPSFLAVCNNNEYFSVLGALLSEQCPRSHLFFFFFPHPSETTDDCISHTHCMTFGQLKPHHPTTAALSQGIRPVHRGTGAEPAISLLQLSLFPRAFRLPRRKTMKTVVPRSLELTDQKYVLRMTRNLSSG